MSNQVHRFHDTVAAYLGKGETVYMSPEQARQFGQALIDAAKDCDAVTFTKSEFPTFRGRTLDD